jgi:hypothetical protein
VQPYALALLVYPGLLLIVVAGVVVEAGTARILNLGRPVAEVRQAVRRLAANHAAPPAATVAALLAILAAAQMTAPFNPVPEADRNLLVAGVALAGAVWLTQPGFAAAEPQRTDWRWLAQVGWLLALLAPAVIANTLSLQVVGGDGFPKLIVVKAVAAVLFVACLPALLGLTNQEWLVRPVRLLLWLPFAGLFASLIFPPASNDLAGVARFFGAALLALVLTAGLALLLSRRRLAATYPAVLAGLLAVTLLVTGVAAYLP